MERLAAAADLAPCWHRPAAAWTRPVMDVGCRESCTNLQGLLTSLGLSRPQASAGAIDVRSNCSGLPSNSSFPGELTPRQLNPGPRLRMIVKRAASRIRMATYLPRSYSAPPWYHQCVTGRSTCAHGMPASAALAAPGFRLAGASSARRVCSTTRGHPSSQLCLPMAWMSILRCVCLAMLPAYPPAFLSKLGSQLSL